MSSCYSRINADTIPRKGCLYKDRVRHSLLVTGFADCWTKIEDCGSGAYCNSSYCRDCRNKNSLAQSRKLIGLYRNYYSEDHEARENMRFVTVLCELVKPNHTAVLESLKRAKLALTTLRRRKSLPGLLLFGRFELEAIDIGRVFQLRTCDRKVETIRALNGDREESFGRDMILVHFHAVMFLNGHDEEVVRNKLKLRWPVPYGISIKRLYKDQSIEDSIRKLCSYPLKDRYRYNYDFRTNGYEDGGYINDGSLSFLVRSSMSMFDKLIIYSKDRG